MLFGFQISVKVTYVYKLCTLYTHYSLFNISNSNYILITKKNTFNHRHFFSETIAYSKLWYEYILYTHWHISHVSYQNSLKILIWNVVLTFEVLNTLCGNMDGIGCMVVGPLLVTKCSEHSLLQHVGFQFFRLTRRCHIIFILKFAGKRCMETNRPSTNFPL